MYQSRHWAAEAAAPRGRWDGWSIAVNWCSSPPSDQRRKSRKTEGSAGGCLGPNVWQTCMERSMDIFGFAGSQLPPVRGPNLFWLDFLRRLLRHLLRRRWLGAWDLVTSGSFALKYSWSSYIMILIPPTTVRVWSPPRWSQFEKSLDSRKLQRSARKHP